MVYCVARTADLIRRHWSVEGGGFFFFRLYYMGVSAGPTTLINKSLFSFFSLSPQFLLSLFRSSYPFAAFVLDLWFASFFIVAGVERKWRHLVSVTWFDWNSSAVSIFLPFSSNLLLLLNLFHSVFFSAYTECILDIKINQGDQTSWQRTLDYKKKPHKKETKSFYSKQGTETSGFWKAGFMLFLWTSSHSIYS